MVGYRCIAAKSDRQAAWRSDVLWARHRGSTDGHGVRASENVDEIGRHREVIQRDFHELRADAGRDERRRRRGIRIRGQDRRRVRRDIGDARRIEIESAQRVRLGGEDALTRGQCLGRSSAMPAMPTMIKAVMTYRIRTMPPWRRRPPTLLKRLAVLGPGHTVVTAIARSATPAPRHSAGWFSFRCGRP
jgi:hypothetical protein